MRLIPEYLPWSHQVLDSCIQQFLMGKLPCLDLETSAVCRHSACIYCDSDCAAPMLDEMNHDSVNKVLKQASMLGTKWLYLCGLGEPTDDPKFLQLLDAAQEADIKISMFTNAVRFSHDLVNTLMNHQVSLIVKLDSLNPSNFDRLLGRPGTADRIFRTIDALLKAGYDRLCQDDFTMIAASIIPTKVNYQDIPNVIKFCVERNIFPSIGELECAGRAKGKYEDLALTTEELLDLKYQVDSLVGYDYQRPTCPAALGGLHVSNTGNIIVDRCTGVCCQWFLLRGPDLFNIGHISEISLSEAMEKVHSYRVRNTLSCKKILECPPSVVFGGCGGRADQILREHIRILDFVDGLKSIASDSCYPKADKS